MYPFSSTMARPTLPPGTPSLWPRFTSSGWSSATEATTVWHGSAEISGQNASSLSLSHPIGPMGSSRTFRPGSENAYR